jgi:hypothetical protein
VDLKQNIRDEVAAVSPTVLQRVRPKLSTRKFSAWKKKNAATSDAELPEKLAGMC